MHPGSVREIVAQALAEDIRSGDLTSRLTIDPAWEAHVAIRARQAGVFVGAEILDTVFDCLADGAVHVEQFRTDGDRLRSRQVIAEVTGPARVVLAGERVCLNFLQRLSGIATLTAKYVAAVKGKSARITDTRKTTPGLRALEKYAVRCGGGVSHRFGLDDCVMIKDNHVDLCAMHLGIDRVEAIATCVKTARAGLGHTVRILTEVETEAEAVAACEAGTDVVTLDNFGVSAMAQCVRRIRRIAPTTVFEATGGVTLRTVAAVAATGVDVISVGELTHSPPALDIGMDIL